MLDGGGIDLSLVPIVQKPLFAKFLKMFPDILFRLIKAALSSIDLFKNLNEVAAVGPIIFDHLSHRGNGAVPQISALVLVILARSWTVIIFLVLLAFTVVEDAMAVLLK